MNRRKLLIGLIALVAIAFTATMMTLIVALAIWPGEAKLVAPLFCSDAQPDAFVVSDTTNVQPGETSTSFTLYCVGPRGDYTDQGWFRPFSLLIGIHAALLVAAIGSVWLVFRFRRARRRPNDSPGWQPSRHDRHRSAFGRSTTVG